jgi:hypothetical protein
VLLPTFKLPAQKILLEQLPVNGIQLQMLAEIRLAEITVDHLIQSVKELAQAALLEPMDFVPLLLHVQILKSELLVFQELMDHVCGLLDIQIPMEQRELVSHIHHARV